MPKHIHSSGFLPSGSKINYQQASVGSGGYSNWGSVNVSLESVIVQALDPMSSAVMAQILDSLPPDHSIYLVCCYVNATSKIQIARIANIPNWYYERVVFPGQRLVFHAPASSLLEIHTGMMASAILSDHIPCERLCIQEEGACSPAEQAAAKANDHNNSQNNFTTAVLTTID